MKTLLPYQEEGATFLATNKRAFLGDEAGLGKTLQAIRACDHIGARRVLVVSPPSVVINWKREFAESSLLDPELEVVTPGTARNHWIKDSYDAVILDEAHYYKSHKSQRTKLVYGDRVDGEGIATRAPFTFLLSGSPVPNNPSELWPHLHALRPELIPGPTGTLGWMRFQQTYCQIQQTPFGPKIVGVRASRIEKLREVLRTFMLRRLENEVDLPELRIDQLYIDAKVARIEGSEDAAAVRDALARGGVAALRELSTHAATLRRLLGLAKVQPVIDYVDEWLTNNDGKICIYAHHREVLDTFRRTFGARACGIDGSTSQADRQRQVDEFQTNDDKRVWIGQDQAAAEAITLTKASETLLVEPDWVPKTNYQIIKRIHRIGQTKPCQARFVTIAGSVDDAINKALARKEAMINTVLEGV